MRAQPPDPGPLTCNTKPARSPWGVAVLTTDSMPGKALAASGPSGTDGSYSSESRGLLACWCHFLVPGSQWEGTHSHVDQMTTLVDYRLGCVCFKQPLNTCPLGCNRSESEGSEWKAERKRGGQTPPGTRQRLGLSLQAGSQVQVMAQQLAASWQPVLLGPEPNEGAGSWRGAFSNRGFLESEDMHSETLCQHFSLRALTFAKADKKAQVTAKVNSESLRTLPAGSPCLLLAHRPPSHSTHVDHPRGAPTCHKELDHEFP